jgi:hypothetical protein
MNILRCEPKLEKFKDGFRDCLKMKFSVKTKPKQSDIQPKPNLELQKTTPGVFLVRVAYMCYTELSVHY